MKDILTKLDKLKSLDCNNTDSVVELMRNIASSIGRKLKDTRLLDYWFFTSDKKYTRCEDIIYILKNEFRILAPNNYNEALDYIVGLLNSIKNTSYEWYSFCSVREQFSNINVEDLAEDKEKFIEQASQILNEKGISV